LISVIVPVYNEEANILPLHGELLTTLQSIDRPFEIVYVDDGSVDSSFARLKELAAECPEITVIQFRRNFGQTAALAAGIEHSRGDILIFMDADLQNDPRDIPRLLEKLDEGYDVVSGWRRDRQDAALTRKLPSSMANWLISRVTGVHLNDYGCTLKAYRREVLENFRLYGEMHRFIPAYAAWSGASITELAVNHRARTAGKSKYGLSRTFKVLLDLATVKFLGGYSTKPIYLFGSAGAISMLAGMLCALAVLYQKVADGVYAHRNPVLLLGVFCFVIGTQFVMMGLLAELIIRTYHESQNKATYVVRQTLKGCANAAPTAVSSGVVSPPEMAVEVS
jgi:glycosyltransferase involved in cell wall biosynthesis